MAPPAKRGAFTGALAILRYNWPFYAAAGLVVIGGVAAASLPIVPPALQGMAAVGAAVAGWFACASFLASHWVFDRSELTRWRWLSRDCVPAPARWVHINAGLDETNARLSEIFPGAEGKVLDIYDPASLAEPAIARAREQKAVVPGIRARSDALPVEDGWADGVFLLMTAHEIRKPSDRETFFRELARILSENGRVVVVEHLRDLANALAFGPGVSHFLPRREWLRLGVVAGLEVERERRFTPFVRVFVYRHAPSGVGEGHLASGCSGRLPRLGSRELDGRQSD